MKTYKISAYIRNGRAQAATDFDIEATRFTVAAYRGARAALEYARASGIKRARMIELRISVMKQAEKENAVTEG